ncbi:hypothetical protein AAG593_07905 [Citromicrobium bathyomarinum]
MRKPILTVAVLFVATATPALAAEYLTNVTSEVYETTGTPREIATRASTCISQHLAPGTTDSQLIINSDLDGGVIVARNAIDQGGLMRWQLRSRFTFTAREGRFRIEQTALERFNQGRWGPIGKWAGSQWRGAEDAFKKSADTVAQCVADVQASDDW